MHYSKLGIASESRTIHEDHLSRMRGYYRRTATQYNLLHCDNSEKDSHNCATREILRLLETDKRQTLLDVGCGTGRAIRAALDAGFEAEGIDLCPELLEIAEKELGIPTQRLH